MKDWSEGNVPEYKMRSASDMAANFTETLDEKSKIKINTKISLDQGSTVFLFVRQLSCALIKNLKWLKTDKIFVTLC